MTMLRSLLVVGLLSALTTPVRCAELNKYLPDDAEWVLGVEIPRLLDAPAAKQHLPGLLRTHGSAGLEALLHLNGVKVEPKLARRVAAQLADIESNRHHLAALRGNVTRVLLSGTGNPIDQHPFLIVVGSFPRLHLEGALNGLATDLSVGRTVTSERVGSRDLFRLRLPGEDEDDVFVLQADDQTLLVALQREDIEKALKRADRERSAPRRELTEAAAKVDPAHVVWLIGAPRQAEAEAWRIGGLTVTDEVTGVLTITARDAQALRDVVADQREELRILRLLTEQQARADRQLTPLIAALASVQQRIDRLTIEMRGTLSAETLRALGRSP